MNKNWRNVLAFIKKELTETLHTMTPILLFSIVVTNLLQYVTMQAVMELGLPTEDSSIQLGSIMMYMSVIIILFVGHTLINRYMHEERTAKTINVMLSGGMNKTAIWSAKLFVAFLLCMVLLLLSVIANMVLAVVVFKLSIRFTVMSAVMTFITMPFLCFGVLSLISVAYWYFKNMSLFGLIFPIATYLGVWNLSIKLVGIEVPAYVALISVALGVGCIIAAAICLKMVPKERITSSTK